jgi:hypothetical protein
MSTPWHELNLPVARVEPGLPAQAAQPNVIVEYRPQHAQGEREYRGDDLLARDVRKRKDGQIARKSMIAMAR